MKKKILCVIPARSGSKGIKNKNMVYLKGKPLIYWTIKVAKKIRYFDKIVVSTNSKKIKKFSEKNKVEVPYLRSEKLASDKTPMDDVIRDILKYYKNFNYLPYAVVILQPTSPFRQLSTINNACKIFIKKKLDSLISIEEIKHNHNPKYLFSNKKNFLKNTLKTLQKKKFRQSEKVYFGLDGGVIFITKTKVINKYIIGGKIGFIKVKMPESIDIDNIDDLNLCKKINLKI